MIEIRTKRLNDSQLLLLNHFEDDFKAFLKQTLNDCSNKQLRVLVGMRLEDKASEKEPSFYELKSNASFELKDSYKVIASLQDYLTQSVPFSQIIPGCFLKIEVTFEQKQGTPKSSQEENNLVLIPTVPKYSLDQVVLPSETRKDILDALKIIKCKDVIYKEWGFEDIDPVPRSVLNFYGEPGTGKTMTAHAVANYLNKKILLLNYAEIESKYVGEAPKNLQKAFDTAKETDAVLFFDEADSFLGKRIQNVTAGSDQALNSLRSQMLILLEEFSGVIIFATNLVNNFDTAFESRILRHLYFGLPNKEARKTILEKMIPAKLPKDDSFTDAAFFEASEKIEGFSGREIKNAVLDMLLEKADSLELSNPFSISDLINALMKKKEAKDKLEEEKNKAVKIKILKKLQEKVEEQNAIDEFEKQKGNKEQDNHHADNDTQLPLQRTDDVHGNQDAL